MFRSAAPALMAALLLATTSACSTLEFPGVYRLPIEQGNILDEDMVAQLKPGMSKSQVEFVLGRALVQDPFTPDRWDYVYTLRGADKSTERKRLTVFFEEGKLSHFISSIVPTAPSGKKDGKAKAQDPHLAIDADTEAMVERAGSKSRAEGDDGDTKPRGPRR